MWVEALELQCWRSGQGGVEDRAFAVAYTHLITCLLTSLSAKIAIRCSRSYSLALLKLRLSVKTLEKYRSRSWKGRNAAYGSSSCFESLLLERMELRPSYSCIIRSGY